MYDDKELKWFDRMGVKRPLHIDLGVEDTAENPLHKQLKRLRTSNWRREGNYIIADTPEGPFHQYLDPKYIVLGTDDEGLPILKEVS